MILYELLTGSSTPIRSRNSLKRAALDEMIRGSIREDEPPTPSHRISTSEGLPSLAANRHVEPARLGRFLRGDLDWIVMKALAKERSRRYDSAIGLANDVERFLNNEPVVAGPPTALYRTAKFIRRHRGQVVAASLLILALLGGAVGTTLGLFEAKRQARRANELRLIAQAESIQKELARQSEANQRILADEQRLKAERRSGQVGKMNEILLSIFTDLDPHNIASDEKPLSAILGERLDKATAEIEGEATGDPLTVARLQKTLGSSQVGLGYPEKGLVLFERAQATFLATLGPDHPETLQCLIEMATCCDAARQWDRAIKIRRGLAPRLKDRFGENNLDTLRCMVWLANDKDHDGSSPESLPLQEKLLRISREKLGVAHSDTLYTMISLASCYNKAGRREDSLHLREEAAKLYQQTFGPGHPRTLRCMVDLASGYHDAGQYQRALEIREETLRLTAGKLGPDHPGTFWCMFDLAFSYDATNQLERARKLREDVRARALARFGENHPETLRSMVNLAISAGNEGKTEDSLKLLEEATRLYQIHLGPDHPDSCWSRNFLANTYHDLNRTVDVIKLWEQTLDAYRAKLGMGNTATTEIATHLASHYLESRQYDRVIVLLEDVLRFHETSPGSDQHGTFHITQSLAHAYMATKQPDRVLPLIERILAKQEERQSLNPSETSWIQSHLTQVTQNPHQVERAETLLRLLEVDAKRRDGSASSSHAGSLASLGSFLIKHKKWAEAEPVLRECLDTRQRIEADDWRTFNASSLLGGAMLGLKQYDKAKPLLEAGYEGLKQRDNQIPPPARVRLTEAVDRLIQLAEETGSPSEAQAWRKERERLVSQSVLPVVPKPTSVSPPPAEGGKP